jgi:hypothetical protein
MFFECCNFLGEHINVDAPPASFMQKKRIRVMNRVEAADIDVDCRYSAPVEPSYDRQVFAKLGETYLAAPKLLACEMQINPISKQR